MNKNALIELQSIIEYPNEGYRNQLFDDWQKKWLNTITIQGEIIKENYDVVDYRKSFEDHLKRKLMLDLIDKVNLDKKIEIKHSDMYWYDPFEKHARIFVTYSYTYIDNKTK